MTEFGQDEYERWLEQELRAAAPEPRALFADELARRLQAQRFRSRPTSLRLGLALAFSSLMIVALGVLGAPGYVAHAATTLVHTATTALTGSGPTGPAPGTAGATSGTDQYAVAHGICQRNGNQFVLVIVPAGDLDQHAARGDIIPAPPWGCPPNPSRGTSPSGTTTLIDGPSQTVRVRKTISFAVTLTSADGRIPQGTVSCFDNLQRFADSVALDSAGEATCATAFQTVGTHSITAVFKTGDVNKWASSAGNVMNVSVAKVTSVLALESSRTPAPSGAGVTFTTVVSGPADAGTPTGSVQFFDGESAVGGPVDLTPAGTATLSTNSLEVGDHTIRAHYSGDAAYAEATATVPQAITAVADRLVVQASPANATAGSAISLTVTAKDAHGNIATGYSGTVTFSGGGASATLPGSYTFAPGNNGSHTFTATLTQAGSRAITATDTATSSIAGTTGTIVVAPAAAQTLTVTGPASATAGVAFSSLTVTARDAFGNTAAGYTGNVSFSGGGSGSTLPASYSFVPGDNGSHTFAATLTQAGSRAITATDTANSSIAGATGTIVVAPASAKTLTVTGPAGATAGVAFSSLTVTAKDAFGNTATGYTGGIHLSSTDPQASTGAGLPADYTFAAADSGTHTFTGVTLKTAGTRTVSATDTVLSTISGSTPSILVTPAASATLTVNAPASATAGSSFDATVTARDAYGNTATGYVGTVHFATTGGQASMPADYTFAAADRGTHTFTGVVLRISGARPLTATDTVAASVSGSASVSVAAAAVNRLVLAAPTAATAGVSFPATVTAKDAFGNTADSYRGTIQFTSSDTASALPGNYTFTAGDNGSHTFAAIVLKTSGSATLKATDTTTSSLHADGVVPVAAASAARFVVSGPASVTAGNVFMVTVKAQDAFGNAADGYRGTVRFGSSDTQAVLPADYRFTDVDAGSHLFNGILLGTAGSNTVTVTDTARGSIAGSATVNVMAGRLTPSPPAKPTAPQPTVLAAAPPTSATSTTQPLQAGSVTVTPASTPTSSGAPVAPVALTVAWAPTTFGPAPAHVSASVDAPLKTDGVQFAAGSNVIQVAAVTDSGQTITALNDALDITIPNAPPDVAPMYQRGSSPWVVIPRLAGTTLPAGQPDGWYLSGSTLHILTRHLTKFALAKALDVKWGTRRRVHLRWAQRIIVYGAPNVDSTATYTLRRGHTVFGTWKRTLPGGKGAPANLWLTGKKVVPGMYRLTIDIQAGPQHWTQVVAIRYL